MAISAPVKAIAIGCRLPHGLILEHPKQKGLRVTLLGLNKSKIIGATHIVTPVDQDFWNDWREANKDLEPLKTGAIFEAKTFSDAEEKAKDLAKVKTGFEPLKPESFGVKTAIATA